MSTLVLALVLALLTSFQTALADEEMSCNGPLQGDSTRYPTMRITPRVVRDLVAVPASAVAWDGADWGRFGAVTLPGLALTWPARPSLDTQVERWLIKHRSPQAGRSLLVIQTLPMSAALLGYGGILFGAAWLTEHDRLFEFGTLSLEALTVVQFWHVTTKLLLGREGPYESPNGAYHGPTQLHFPGGTPSGHSATTYAVLTVAAEYWQKMPLYVLVHLVGAYVSVSLVYHAQHFLSDVLWGAAMGYYTGRWIVRHRSSRYRCQPRASRSLANRILVLPTLGSSHVGVTLSLRI